jgi:hypothetical protein
MSSTNINFNFNGDPGSDDFVNFTGTNSGHPKDTRYPETDDDETDDETDAFEADAAEAEAKDDADETDADDGDHDGWSYMPFTYDAKTDDETDVYDSEEEKDPYEDPAHKLLHDFGYYPADFCKYHDSVYPPSVYPVDSDSDSDSDSSPDETYRYYEPTFPIIQY